MTTVCGGDSSPSSLAKSCWAAFWPMAAGSWWTTVTGGSMSSARSSPASECVSGYWFQIWSSEIWPAGHPVFAVIWTRQYRWLVAGKVIVTVLFAVGVKV